MSLRFTNDLYFERIADGTRSVDWNSATFTNYTIAAVADGSSLALGTDSDWVLVNRATTLGANTALTSVLVGTPVTPAIAANSLIQSGITANGDYLLAAQTGGNSQAWLWVDSSAGLMTLYGAGTEAARVSATAFDVSVALRPLTNDLAALGSTTLGWSDLFLATGGVINWNNGEVTITETDANTLTIVGISTLLDLNFAGTVEFNSLARWDTGRAITATEYAIGRDADATNQLHFNIPTGATMEWSVNDVAEMLFSATNLTPGADDGNALGSATVSWSDLFLASGAVINFNNGNVTLTHAAGGLTLAGATLSTNSSVLSTGATQGMGYGTGAGGTVTQITSRSTAVTLNKITGAITTDTTALAAAAEATFTVNNTTVAATDTVVLSIKSGSVGGTPVAWVSAVATNSFNITISNTHASVDETGAIVINFAVIKAVAA